MIETQVLMTVSDFLGFFSKNYFLEGGFTFQWGGEVYFPNGMASFLSGGEGGVPHGGALILMGGGGFEKKLWDGGAPSIPSIMGNPVVLCLCTLGYRNMVQKSQPQGELLN